jgi:hypothetical protein
MNAGAITGVTLLCVSVVSLTVVMLLMYQPAYQGRA